MNHRDQVRKYYSKKFIWLRNCLYCGEPAVEYDHVFPVSLASQLDLKRLSTREYLKFGLMTVPSCRECNMIAGNEPFMSPLEKRAFIKRALIKKYKELARVVVWDQDEIDELGPALKTTVELAMQTRAKIELRLSWPLGRTCVSLEVARRLCGP